MASLVGCTLELKTKGGTFEGVLIDIQTGSTKKITLNKVKEKVSGKRLKNLCHFYSSEILEGTLKVLDTNTKKTVPITEQQPDLQSQPAKNGAPQAIPVNTRRQADEDQDNGDNRKHHVGSPEDTDPSAWRELKNNEKGYILIDRIGKTFRKVVNEIKQQHFIAFCVSGVNIGRRGDLHLVQIYADEVAYLFDFKSIGPALFSHEKGNLGEILDSHKIVKVVHDSRWMSNLLYHCFGIPLNCVYDTQVADILITHTEKGGDTPRQTRALPECLLEYLEISISEVFSKMVHNRLEMAEEQLWQERPLHPDLLESAMRNVRYLLDLRVATLRRLMGELMCATHIYLTCVRDMSDTMGTTTRGQDPSLVPYKLLDFFRHGMRSHHIYEEYQLQSGGDMARDSGKPWDLWQTGQKLNPSLHTKSPSSQFADAPSSTGDQANRSHQAQSTVPSAVINQPQGLPNGLPGGAEDGRLTDEASSSDDEDVFGEDSNLFAWRRGPTVEGVEDNQSLLVENDPPAEVSKPLMSSPHASQNLYDIKCATDLYNLPVNGLQSSSTSTEEGEEEAEEEIVPEEDNEPMQWPVVDSASSFVARPAGIEEGTLFEALPSGSESSPWRQVKSDAKQSSSKPECVIDQEESLPLRNITGAINNPEPPSLLDLHVEPPSLLDLHVEPPSLLDLHVSCQEQGANVSSHSSHVSKPFHYANHEAGPSSTSRSEYSPKTRRLDQQRYMPPRMREIPPRFRKPNTNNSANHAYIPNHVVNDVVESGSESSSSSSSASGQRSGRGSPYVERAPATFGEMMARLSDHGGRDSDSSNGEANGRRQRSDESGTTTSSEDHIKYDDIVAARAAGARPKGRGRARALREPVAGQREQQMQRERIYGTQLVGSEVRMDFPSDYEIYHAPKAVPIRAGSNLLSVKTMGRGISHM